MKARCWGTLSWRLVHRSCYSLARERGRAMAHLLQVGAGSGGMPVLDMLCREPRITRVTLIEPDVYKAHNVERHLFPIDAVGQPKAVLAERWLKERRPDLEVTVFACDLHDP